MLFVFSTGGAFAALKDDGSVVTWGRPIFGGNSSSVSSQLSSGVTQIFSNGNAFAALKNDGSVVTWGGHYQPNGKYFYGYNGGGDTSAVKDKLTSGVKTIFSTGQAFAALKNDGSVVTWGAEGAGGGGSIGWKKHNDYNYIT